MAKRRPNHRLDPSLRLGNRFAGEIRHIDIKRIADRLRTSLPACLRNLVKPLPCHRVGLLEIKNGLAIGIADIVSFAKGMLCVPSSAPGAPIARDPFPGASATVISDVASLTD
jgi:hypothetical protein